MTENEKIELFDKWYAENYDEWAEGEEGIALREELEQAFMGGIAGLEEKYSKQADDFENMKAGLESEIAELKEENKQLRNNYDDYKAVAEDEIMKLKDLLLELYDCISASLGDICQETLQKVALVFKED